MRELSHHGVLQSYRTCPKCGEKFTVDSDTKIRQALFILAALVSLAFTMLLYFAGSSWLTPAIASYVAIALLLYWGNSRVRLVPLNKSGRDTQNGT
jgi:uncharacterized protein (UPF0212 family)